MSPLHLNLLKIQQTNSFELLNPYKDPKIWLTLKDQERHLLSELILRQGAHYLTQGNHEALNCFELAAELAHHSPGHYYHQGMIFSNSNSVPTLKFALQAFEKAIEKQPNFKEALLGYADASMKLGHIIEETDYIFESIKKIEKALELTGAGEQAELLWRIAFAWFSIGKLGGEPSDFLSAINYFRRAYQIGGLEDGYFWYDYGKTLLEVGIFQENPAIYEEAWNVFTQAEKYLPDNNEITFCQGCCLLHLAKLKESNAFYLESIHKLSNALITMSEDARVWYMLGNAEADLGRLTENTDLIRNALSKFEKAHQLDPHKTVILILWSEAELYLGTEESDIEMLQAAKKRIVKTLELEPERSEVWYLLGNCLNELASYFEEISYYEEALKKFNYGLSLSNPSPILWYGKAISHYALGEYLDSPNHIKESIDCFAKASESTMSNGGKFNNDWAIALMKWGEISEQVEFVFTAIKLLEDTVKSVNKENFHKQIEIIFSYAYGLYLLAQFIEDKEYLEQAINLLTQIVEIEPSQVKARYTLALALGDLAEEESSVQLYEKAIENLCVILNSDPEYDAVCIDCGIAMVSLALLKADLHVAPEVIELYKQAEQLFLKALMSGSNEASYHLAGLCSLLGNFEAALHYLDKSLRSGNLPPKEHIMNDEWLEDFRHTPYFEDFITDLP